ncbi:MAG: alpha-glucosidase [Spirochaetes bacterium]|nr:alpha-glucosidase [Spirochaetota bacterium]
MKFESDPDGFSISVDGRPAIVHSAKSPAFEIGTADLSVRQTKAGFRLKRRKYIPVKLRDYTLVESDALSAVVDFSGRFRVSASCAGGNLRLSFSRFTPEINVFRMRIPAHADEQLYGLGERCSRLDLKGSRVPLWVGERAAGRGSGPGAFVGNARDDTRLSLRATCFPMPCFVSSRGYFVDVDTAARSIFDFRKPGRTSIEVWGVPVSITLGFRRTAPETVAALGDNVGRQKAPPPWVFGGAWLGVQGGTDEILRKAQAALDSGARVSALWVQDWCGHRTTKSGRQPEWNWRYDEMAYPALQDTIADLAGAGIRFLGYVNPYLSTEGGLYREASRLGYCIQRPEGGDYLFNAAASPAAMVDLTDPDAFDWIKGVIRDNMIGIGMSGWMADSGECLPADAVLSSGKSGLAAHNSYPVLWARANAEAVGEAGKSGETVFFLRSGWSGSARHAAAFWTGDRFVDMKSDDGLPSVIQAAISLGISGGGIWHSDIGGNTSTAWRRRSPETFMRWAELAAFTPIMRTHEGQHPGVNHQFWTDDRTLRHFARCTEIFAALSPYHQAVMQEYAGTGVPPIRHCWLHYEDDAQTHRHGYQYLYGRDLLVAPVHAPGRELHELYLPDDAWVHLWSSRVFRGGTTTVEAPLGYPPVFYRESSNFASVFDSVRRNVRKI